jgi:hypothetical protein
MPFLGFFRKGPPDVQMLGSWLWHNDLKRLSETFDNATVALFESLAENDRRLHRDLLQSPAQAHPQRLRQPGTGRAQEPSSCITCPRDRGRLNACYFQECAFLLSVRADSV